MPVTEQQVRDFFDTVYKSEYFTSFEISRKECFNNAFLVLTLHSENVKITIDCAFGPNVSHLAVTGDVCYLSFSKWYTFTRRGIDDSFSSPYGMDLSSWDVNLVILEQIERAETAISRAQVSGPRITIFPGISITQKRLDEAIVTINSYNRATFTPNGMGTGYAVSRHPDRWSRRVSADIQKIFKSDVPLFYTTTDCD